MLNTVEFWQFVFVVIGLVLLLFAAFAWWSRAAFHKVILAAFFIGLGYFLPLIVHVL